MVNGILSHGYLFDDEDRLLPNPVVRVGQVDEGSLFGGFIVENLPFEDDFRIDRIARTVRSSL